MRTPRLTSIDWQRADGSDDRAVVRCDRYRPAGMAFLIGQTVEIDGALYHVVRAQHPHLTGPLRKGEQVVLWVRPHF
jgi:hypothetical protein